MNYYIEQLLIKHDCVIVPGLGGFLVRRESSYKKGILLFAPRKEVGFNPLLTYSDGLLAEAVMKKEHINYEQALLKINYFTNSVQTKLSLGKNVIIGALGYLNKADGQISFASNMCDFLPDNMALPAVRLNKLEQNSQVDNRQLIIRIQRPSRQSFKLAFAFIVLMVLSMVAPYSDNTNQNMATFALKNHFFSSQTDSNRIKSQTIVSNDSNTKKQSLQISKPVTLSIEMPYHIIVASLKTKKRAENYYDTHKKIHGFEKMKIIKHKTYFLISIDDFSSRSKAINRLDSLHSASIDSWILIR